VQPRAGGSIIPPPAAISTYGTPGPYVYDTPTARRIPAVTRALGVYGGLTKQMPLDAYRGDTKLARPRICARPDPDRARAWFVQLSVEDYLLYGNAISLVTARGVDGWPLTVMWLNPEWTYIVWDVYAAENAITYYYVGQPLPFEDVVHVRRGADRSYPVRGIGVVEEHLGTLDRVAMEEEYERGALSTGGVPSVAVITPQATIDQPTADQAKADWLAKFSGPQREPVILPNGTQVLPLAWSPTDTQLTEARKLSNLDVANMFNLDGYWVGAPTSGMTYRTAGPQYLQVLRTSIEGLLADLEDIWGNAWLPRGTDVRFDRRLLLREELGTATTAAVAQYNAGIASLPEARDIVGLSATTSDELASAADRAPPPVAPPADNTAPEQGGQP
jgi:HK97 family phage portal protein